MACAGPLQPEGTRAEERDDDVGAAREGRKAGIAPEGFELTHAGFGTMNGADGKPFKTRAGGVMKLEDLIEVAVNKAQGRLDEGRCKLSRTGYPVLQEFMKQHVEHPRIHRASACEFEEY